MAVFTIHEHVIPTAHIREYPRATAKPDDERLKLAVKQYTPVEPRQGQHQVNVIAAHANGFPKELYEPLWEDLYRSLKKRGVYLSNVFMTDVTHQGQSGIINEEILGNDPSWNDHPRDLFLMVNHFRSELQRPIIGIGHSMGGNNIANLSLLHPRLFTTLVMIDPVFSRRPLRKLNMDLSRTSARRRDRWPSRKAARDAFVKAPFFKTWDSRVLDRWISHGLRDFPSTSSTTEPTDANGPMVTLSTARDQEVFSFLRPNFESGENPSPMTSPNRTTHPDVDTSILEENVPFYRPEGPATFYKLPFVRPSVHYIFGELSYLCSTEAMADKMEMTGSGVGGSGGVKLGRVSSIVMKGAGHLMPMENVKETADLAAAWVKSEIDRWARLELQEQERWAKVQKKRHFSDEYLKVLNGDWTAIKDREYAKGKL